MSAAQDRDHAAAAVARRCVEARRVMLGAWRDEHFGRMFALDLMGIVPERLTTGNVEYADLVRSTLAESLVESTLYIADDDMVALMDVAAPTMPDQVLREDDLLSPHGFLWFADPLPDRSGTSPAIPFAAIHWALLAPGHRLLERNRGEGLPLDEGDTGYGVLIHAYSDTIEAVRAQHAAQGRPDQPGGLAPGAPGLLPSASVMWMVGSPIGTAFGRTTEDLSERRGTPIVGNDTGFFQRALAAFWTLARQPLTTTTETAAARPDRRRSARAGIKNTDQPIQVLRLRHSTGTEKSTHTTSSGRTVSVRFPVRGFWRNQYLPSTDSHRQQYIAPHWRGPETARVVGGERVFLAQGRDAHLPEDHKS